jgi:serine/threonine protein kinase
MSQPTSPVRELPEHVTPLEAEVADWSTPPTAGEVITSLATGNTYTIGEKIGEGNFGLVYSCVDVWQSELAVKVLKPLGPYERVKASAEAEIGKLLYLRHPHITYVFDAFEYRATFYIVTERCFCPLTHLFTLENYDGRAWIMPIARCLLQAVHYIHNNQYCHQDIHLGNVFAAFARNEMNTNDPGAIQFKLGDLGVAKVFSEIDATNTRALWMLPPEILDPTEFGPIDQRLDLYHCGLVFLHLMLGHEMRFTSNEIKAGRPRDIALQLPTPFNFALEKALRRHVASRTASAMELWRDLNSPPLLAAAPAPEEQMLLSGSEEPTG